MSTLSSLPSEIKAEIVSLLHQQDANFKEKAETSRKEFKSLAGALSENPWRGRSLNSLFCCSKEWNQLAAVKLFHTITSHQILSGSLELYKFVIIPEHGAKVQGVEFSPSKSRDQQEQQNSSWSELLSSLATFPNVKSFKLQQDAYKFLFENSASTLNIGQQYRLIALRTPASHISALELADFSSAQALKLIKLFPNVKILKFDEGSILDGEAAESLAV